MQAARLAVLNRMNVAFLVNDRDLDPLRWPRVRVDDDGRAWLYRHPAPLPRAYVLPRTERHADEASAVARFASVDPREAVLMPEDPLGPVRGPRQAFTTASYESVGPDHVIVRVATEAPGLLVVCDTWMPGWTATLDGEPVPLLRGDRAWRVVALPRAGRHGVVMRYRPPALAPGAAVTGAGLAAWTVLGAALVLRRPR
jgi:hypothetical protein